MGNYSLVIPQECGKITESKEFYFGDDLKTAESCKAALETANHGKAFRIRDDSSATECEAPGGCSSPRYYVGEGLINNCVEGEGGSFKALIASINEKGAQECAHSLNRIEQGKNSGVTCVERNIGGIISDNWEVTCNKAK